MQAIFRIFSGFFRFFRAGAKKALRISSRSVFAPQPHFEAVFQDLMFVREKTHGFRGSFSVPKQSRTQPQWRLRIQNKQEASKKENPGSGEGPGKKVRNRTQFNYLYLITVPVSLTVTVLIPQMQFWS